MTWHHKVLVVCAGLVVAGGIAAWMAVGQLAESTDRALLRTQESLVLAKQLSSDTVDTAEQFSAALQPVGDGIGSTVDALVATREVSAGIRNALSSIRFIDNVQEVRQRLENAEAALVDVEADLGAASARVAAARTSVQRTIESLRDIPGQLDAAIADVADSRQRVDKQVVLWRVALVAIGAALLGMFTVLASLSSRRTSAEALRSTAAM